MSKFIVTVHEVADTNQLNQEPSAIEIFKQGFDTLDLSKFVVALNQKPRGRKPAKKEVAL